MSAKTLAIAGLLIFAQAQGQQGTAPVLHSIDERGVKELKEKSIGKVLVLNVWATWCTPCVEELPDLVKLQRTYAVRGMSLVLISIDDDARARQKAAAVLKKARVAFPTYLKKSPDDERFINAVDASWSGALPATFIYDKKGQLVERIVEGSTFHELEKHVKPLL